MKNLISTITFTILIFSCTAKQRMQTDTLAATLQNSMIWLSVNDTVTTPISVGFRKQLEISGNPQKAELLIFADSRYLLWINGNYVERGPCRFDPKGPQYDLVNLKGHIHEGLNTIAIMVQGNATGKENLKIMKHSPGLTALLRTDGQQFVTDSTWLCSDKIPQQLNSDIWTWSCLLDKVDANTPDFNWQLPRFDDSNWKPAVPVSGKSWGNLTQRTIPMLRETDLGSGTILQIKNNKFTDTIPKPLPGFLPAKFNSGDEVVIDIGKLGLVYWTIKMSAEKNTELEFSPCQDFINGETIINYNCLTTYKARDGEQTYMSGDTYGFRYLKIKVVSGTFTPESIRFTARQYPNIELASFECNDHLLNKIWQQTSYTAQVLCEDGYVDSAERAEWMGDAGMLQYAVSRMVISGPGSEEGDIIYSDPRLLRNMLVHTAQSQMNDGRLKAHHPSDRFDLHWYIEDYSCLWVQALREYFENTADKKTLEELWPVLEKQMDWFLNRKNEIGLYTAREFLIHLDNPLRYQVCQGATVNAFIYKAMIDAASLGEELDKKELSEKYKQKAGSLKIAYNKYLWDEVSQSFYSAVYYPDFSGNEPIPELKPVPVKDPASESKTWSDGNVQWIEKGQKVPPTVQAALVALNRGIVSEEHTAAVKKYLLNHYNKLKNPYTYRMLFDELYSYNQDSLDSKALDIIRQKWNTMVSRVSPGTSTEAFETQGYLCHPFGLVPAYVLPAYVLGVRKPQPIWEKTILIEPRLGDLIFAKGVGLTEFGPVPVEWQREENVLKFSFEIPEKCKAVVRLPKQGQQNQLVCNGKPVGFKVGERFLEFKVKPGKYQGEVKGLQ